MRLLVTDRAEHALRRATAWLIMTLGRKIYEVLHSLFTHRHTSPDASGTAW